MRHEPEREVRSPRDMSLNEAGLGSSEDDLETRHRTAAHPRGGVRLPGRQRAGRLSLHGPARRLRLRHTGAEAAELRRVEQGRTRGSCVALSPRSRGGRGRRRRGCSVSTARPGASRTGAAVRRARSSGATPRRTSVCLAEVDEKLGGVCGPSNPAGDAASIRALWQSALRALGGAVEQPSVPCAPQYDVPASAQSNDEDQAHPGVDPFSVDVLCLGFHAASWCCLSKSMGE